MENLKRSGVPAEAIIHLNLEEPALGPDLDERLFDRVYLLYRTEIHPTDRAWVFLDDVQRVPGWERWVRARGDSEDVKIFVTGSSAQLMS